MYASFGLSPLARGTPSRRTRATQTKRSIPARAGNTTTARAWCGWSTVYPRSRGEHACCSTSALSNCGLSPLARGTQRQRHVRPDRRRFIPARAGNTRRDSTPAAAMAVYPRSRGEHISPLTWTSAPAGLSPLARGTRHLWPVGDQAARFIPARAGNTRIVHYCNGRMPVYPRSRGEHSKAIQLFYKGIFHTQQSTNLFITSPHS